MAVFLKTKSSFQHVKKKMALIAYAFPKLDTAKDVLRKMSKKIRFKTTFDSQHSETVKVLRQSRFCDTTKIRSKGVLSHFLITLRNIQLENVCLSDISNLRTVC